jgi:NAD(P)-dependent dehydrogenase (short-subunit alcohol dehydrogenase family)
MAQPIPFGSRSTADQVLAGIDLSRKRVLITECDSAIGLETMKALSANGAMIIGVTRTLAEAAVACNAVGRAATPLGCDPTDLASVDAAMDTLRGLSSPLDAVIINSVELRCFADHIAQFVLVNRLVELVRHGTGRIVIGSNDADIEATPAANVMLDDLNNGRIYDSQALRGQTTLAVALFAQELSRQLQARGVAVNAFHSENRKSAGQGAARLIHSLLGYFGRSPAQRAATAVLLAASPLVVGTTGQYWSRCRICGTNPVFSDAGLAKRFWDVSAQIAAMMSGRVDSPRQPG